MRASGAKQQFKSSSQISSGCIVGFGTPSLLIFVCAKRDLTNWTTSSLVITSQMPSHARTTNSQSSSTVNCCTSGNAADLESFNAIRSKIRSKANLIRHFITGYDLLLRRFTIVSFEYEIPEGTRQRQIAVYPLVLHETTRRFNALPLVLQRGLMVSTEGHCPAVDARYCSAVTRISL